MSRSHRAPPSVAFVEDCDDDTGSSVEGIRSTRMYAVSEAAPSKPLPNSSRSRTNEHYRPSPGRRGESSASNSDSTTRSSKKGPESKRDKEARQRQKEYEREDRRKKDEKARRQKAAEERVAKDTKALKKVRPAGTRAATLPVVQQTTSHRRPPHDDPRAYGIHQPPPPPPPGSRPRASSRPASFAGPPPRYPPSNMGGWPPGPGGPPAPFPVGTFPPPQMFPGGPHPGMHVPMPPPSPSNAGSYMDGPPPMAMQLGRDLRHRFEARPSSAMGFSPSQRSYLQEEFGFDDEPQPPPPRMGRRPSTNRGHDEDRKRMPPPDYIPSRPRTTANPSTPFNPPPSRPASRHGHQQSRSKGANRRSMGFHERPVYVHDDEENLLSPNDLFHDISPEPNYDQRRLSAARIRHRSVYADEDEDEDEDEEEEFAISPGAGRSIRRGSMHTAALGSGGVSLERDRYLDAMRYQDDVNGGQQMPLTADALRKASKRGEGASSRSTRSSDSRDESEYKRSNTTGITRSSSGAPDDFTIKVSGAAVVRFEGAEIECDDGEITFSNNRPGTSRVGSDRASTIYQLEDSRSRFERKALPHRPRAPSQSDAQSRAYAPSHAPYEHAPYEHAPYEHAPYAPYYG